MKLCACIVEVCQKQKHFKPYPGSLHFFYFIIFFLFTFFFLWIEQLRSNMFINKLLKFWQVDLGLGFAG